MSANVNDGWGAGYEHRHVPAPPPHAPAVNFSGDAFEQADAATRYAARQFDTYAEQLGTVSGLDERTKAEALEEFANTPAARAAAASVEAAAAHRDQLAAQPEIERTRLANTGPDAGAQIAAQRQWDRDRQLLDSQANVGQVHATASDLIRNATPAQLAVLAEEIQPYLAAKGQPSSWVRDALARVAPQLGEAQTQAADADRRVIKLRHNSKVVSESYKAHRPVGSRLIDPT